MAQDVSLSCESCSGGLSPLRRGGGDWYRCAACGLTQLDSRLDEARALDLYGDSYFTGGGSGYPDYVSESRLLREHGRRYARVVAQFLSPGRLLDVGGAAGYVAAGFCDAGWRATVLEPNRGMATIATSLGEESQIGVLETFKARKVFDLVAMIQVVAHLFDLRKALETVAAVTADRGYLLVETWNGDSATARFFKSQWHEFSPPSVRRIFTPAALDRALADYGFTPVAKGRPQKWLSGSHAKSLLAHKSAESAMMRIAQALARLIPDGARIPYPAEDLFWALYCKSSPTTNAPARAGLPAA